MYPYIINNMPLCRKCISAQDYYDGEDERKNDVCTLDGVDKCLRVDDKDTAKWYKKNDRYKNGILKDCEWDKPKKNCGGDADSHVKPSVRSAGGSPLSAKYYKDKMDGKVGEVCDIGGKQKCLGSDASGPKWYRQLPKTDSRTKAWGCDWDKSLGVNCQGGGAQTSPRQQKVRAPGQRKGPLSAQDYYDRPGWGDNKPNGHVCEIKKKKKCLQVGSDGKTAKWYIDNETHRNRYKDCQWGESRGVNCEDSVVDENKSVGLEICAKVDGKDMQCMKIDDVGPSLKKSDRCEGLKYKQVQALVGQVRTGVDEISLKSSREDLCAWLRANPDRK